MGIKFKEKNTGFVVEFEYQVDIDTTRTHPDYVEIIEEAKEDAQVVAVVKRKSKD